MTSEETGKNERKREKKLKTRVSSNEETAGVGSRYSQLKCWSPRTIQIFFDAGKSPSFKMERDTGRQLK